MRQRQSVVTLPTQYPVNSTGPPLSASMAVAARTEPFKIMRNFYFVCNANGEVFLLTSPQGHIMVGTGAANSAEAVQHNIEIGSKKTEIKAILTNHNHGDQSGGAVG